LLHLHLYNKIAELAFGFWSGTQHAVSLFIQRQAWLLNTRIPDMVGKPLSCMDIAKTWFGAVNTSHNGGVKARETSRMTCTIMVFLFVLKRSRLPIFFASTIECC
jgi:hypothetical protein